MNTEKIFLFLFLHQQLMIQGLNLVHETSEEKEWIKADALLNKPVIIDEFVQKLEAFFEITED